jgi:site-specific recombinase XerD
MRNYAMALLMLDAGLRVGEVVQLQVSDLFFAGKPVIEIRVRPEISKRHYERWVPVADRLKAAIGQMNGSIWEPQNRDPSSIAFYSSKRTERISYQHVEQIIKQAAHSFTSRNITPHMLRHTFATNLMRKTDMPTLQQLLGHKRLSSTQIYTHPSSEDRRRAIDRMQESS